MTSEIPSKLRIGLLVDGPFVSKYVYNFVLWASEQTNIEISHLIIHKDTSEAVSTLGKILKTLKREGLERTLARMMFRVVVTMESLILIRRNKSHREHFMSYDISHLVANSVTITPKVSRSGYVQRFSDDDVASVAGLGLDVLIRFGTGILRGDILQAAKHGTISFHHADNRVMRGGPSGFWEVYHQWDKTGFIIQKLTEELDGGIVLKRGSFPTQYSYLINQISLHRKSYVHLQNLISGIARTGQLPPAEEPAPYSAMPFTVPSTWRSLRYAAYLARALLIKTLAKLTNYHRRWSISYIRSNWRSAVLWRSSTIPNPVGRFLADPFVITKEGRTYCFAEDYVYKTGRGHISVVEIADDGPKQVQPCLVEPFHLSFPYLFHAGGTLYMCPETSEKREIRVYRSVDFPCEWKLERTLMRDVCAVDTMLFEHGGRWWMFTNIDPASPANMVRNCICSMPIQLSAPSGPRIP